MPATVAGAAEGRASSAPAPLAPGASAIADAPTGPPCAATAAFALRACGRLAGPRRGRLERLSRRAGGPAADPAPPGRDDGRRHEGVRRRHERCRGRGRRQQPRVADGHRRFDAAHPVRRPAAGGSRPVPAALGCAPHRALIPRRPRPRRRPDEPPGGGPPLHLDRAHRTPDAARRQRAHLPRIFRVAAPDDVEGRARQRGLRLLQHRPARHRRHPPRLRRGRLRPPGSDLPPRAVRRVQGDPPAHARRPARPVPQGPRGGQGVAHPGLRAGGLRGRRRHRHDHGRRRAPRPGDHDRDRRSRHAPARHRPHPAHDHAVGRREHDPVRPGPDRRAVRPRPRPDDRLQGAQGRPDRQHPGRARASARRRRPSSSASSGRSRRCTSGSTRSSPTSCATSSSSIATRCSWARTSRRSCATCRSTSISRRRGSATTTARPSSGCSASTSSARSSNACRR